MGLKKYLISKKLWGKTDSDTEPEKEPASTPSKRQPG
jgi:hypothetical protein